MADSYFDAILPQSTGVDILNTANDAARSDRSARIAELERELAEIRKQKAQFSEEGEMGKYKFLYDADPSAYMNYRQNMRNAEQTEKIRKATEDATKASNLQQLWKQNNIDIETTKYSLEAAQQAYGQAKANNDQAGMEKADLEIRRQQGILNRLGKQQKQLSSQLFKDFDFGEDVETVGNGADKKASKSLEEDKAVADDIEIISRNIDDIQKRVKTDNINIDQTEKEENVRVWSKELDELEKAVKDSPLSEANKTPYLNKIRDTREAIREYAKPGNKGGQAVKPDEVAEAKKAVYNDDGSMKNRTKLEALGSTKLRKYAKLLNEDFSNIIDDLERKGK